MGYTIKTIDGELREYAFDFGGVIALRNFTAETNGQRLIIKSAANANFSILDALVNEVEIDGVVYDNAEEAQAALQELVFNPNPPVILNQSELDALGNNIVKVINIPDNVEFTEQALADYINTVGLSVGANEIVFFNSNETPTAIFKPGKGEYGQSKTNVTADDFFILNTGSGNSTREINETFLVTQENLDSENVELTLQHNIAPDTHVLVETENFILKAESISYEVNTNKVTILKQELYFNFELNENITVYYAYLDDGTSVAEHVRDLELISLTHTVNSDSISVNFSIKNNATFDDTAKVYAQLLNVSSKKEYTIPLISGNTDNRQQTYNNISPGTYRFELTGDVEGNIDNIIIQNYAPPQIEWSKGYYVPKASYEHFKFFNMYPDHKGYDISFGKFMDYLETVITRIYLEFNVSNITSCTVAKIAILSHSDWSLKSDKKLHESIADSYSCNNLFNSFNNSNLIDHIEPVRYNEDLYCNYIMLNTAGLNLINSSTTLKLLLKMKNEDDPFGKDASRFVFLRSHNPTLHLTY